MVSDTATIRFNYSDTRDSSLHIFLERLPWSINLSALNGEQDFDIGGPELSRSIRTGLEFYDGQRHLNGFAYSINRPCRSALFSAGYIHNGYWRQVKTNFLNEVQANVSSN